MSSIRIGGASGFWGDSATATAQLLAAGGLDYIVYDYLAEITMSILARVRSKDETKGFAADFVTAALAPNLTAIAKQGVKIISNAGGVNPVACASAVEDAIKGAGLDLRVAVVLGDDLLEKKDDIAAGDFREMFSGEAPPAAEKIASINAYLGAFPIAEALGAGADIVITGRCVDSATTLGACIHSFGWTRNDFDKLAGGSLAGHILECGPQATGGNFTDWEEVASSIDNIGYPIAEIRTDGACSISKPERTGGLVSVGTVSEQILYEIGDPQAYMLPDVVCDFSQVSITPEGDNTVNVSGARGAPAPATYKASLTYQDGFRTGLIATFYGFEANRKAQSYADAAFERSRNILRSHNAPDFTETSVEIIGAESQYGDFSTVRDVREVAVKIAAKHPDPMGVGLLLREATALGLATPPGLSGFSGARPKPSPVFRLHSFLLPKSEVNISIRVDGDERALAPETGVKFARASIKRPPPPPAPTRESEQSIEVLLIDLAWGRSGDKGDKANIGVIARDPRFLPYIWDQLTEDVAAARFRHFLKGSVERYLLPGPNAVNFVLNDVLGGGGVASIRNDPQGKGYAQILLATPIRIPASLHAMLRPQ